MSTQFEFITQPAELDALDSAMRSAEWVAFDTEFVSEYSYRPQLCLIQIAIPDQILLIDTIKIPETAMVWDWLLLPDRPVIVHAGREEYLFCHRATGTCPSGWFDVQLAAGLVTTEYPASYGKLVDRFCGKTLPKGETRTDWRKRPLTPRQQDYASQDVAFLFQVYTKLIAELNQRDRMSWFDAEMQFWTSRVEASISGDAWHRLSGIHRLSRRQLGVVQEVWRWREQMAETNNVFPRRILRDDLVIELARRESADLQRIKAIRGMEWRKLSQNLDQIAEAIQRGLDTPNEALPNVPTGGPPSTLGNLLPQFLNTALNSLCVAESVAPSLVGTMQDVRDFSQFHLEKNQWKNEPAPRLMQGWRRDLIGNLLNQLIDGELAIRIENPKSDHPLVIESTESPKP